MAETGITITIHDHLDPECVRHQGVRAPRGLRWLFRCDTCFRDRADAEEAFDRYAKEAPGDR